MHDLDKIVWILTCLYLHWFIINLSSSYFPHFVMLKPDLSTLVICKFQMYAIFSLQNYFPKDLFVTAVFQSMKNWAAVACYSTYCNTSLYCKCTGFFYDDILSCLILQMYGDLFFLFKGNVLYIWFGNFV